MNVYMALPIMACIVLGQPCQLGLSVTYHCFERFSKHRRYCQLPVSGRRMQRFLRFRLGLTTCLLLLVD